jgi:hypothetical protein
VYRFTRRSRLFVALLCVAMVALRVGGFHVHMCLDGSEPPLSLHAADSGVHHLDEPVASETHVDRDLAIASDLVVKKPSGDFGLSLLAAFSALLLFLLVRPRELLAFPPLPALVRSARTRLRPPLRGPPRLA